MQKPSLALCALLLALILPLSLRAQQPVILRFQPPAAASGATVTIIGQNFVNVSKVLFAGIPARSFTVNISGDTIRAIVSSNAASGLITVVQPTGTATSTAFFTFLGCPLISSWIGRVLPSPIPASARDIEITIQGFFNLGGDTPKVLVNRYGKDSLLLPIRFTGGLIHVTMPTLFISEAGTLRIAVTGLCTSPASTTATIQAQSPTNVEMIPPVPERIFPNPVNDMLTVETTLDSPSALTFTLFNTLGQQLIRLQQDAPRGRFSTVLPCHQLASGAYILAIQNGEHHDIHHFVKY